MLFIKMVANGQASFFVKAYACVRLHSVPVQIKSYGECILQSFTLYSLLFTDKLKLVLISKMFVFIGFALC